MVTRRRLILLTLWLASGIFLGIGVTHLWFASWRVGLATVSIGLLLILLSIYFFSDLLQQLFKALFWSEVAVEESKNQWADLKVVAIGGGTGMPQFLRGIRQYTDSITAIVTVADDGGSSGRLRRQMRMLPPGDFRNNIAALSESEELIRRLFQYRFANHEVTLSEHVNEDGSNEPRQAELGGHSFGNLFIATMAAVTGSFESGLKESSRVLAVRGRVLPSTLEQVNLCAEMRYTQVDEHGTEIEKWMLVEGESRIPEAEGEIMSVFLQPENPRAYPEAVRAILQADLIVAGPGSFFTSVIPNLLVKSICDAICASSAPSIYLCNVATQPGETDNFGVSDHMAHLRKHAGDAFTTVLANANQQSTVELPASHQWVTLPRHVTEWNQINRIYNAKAEIEDNAADMKIKYTLFTGDLVDDARPWRHDSDKLAKRALEIYLLLQS